MQYFILIKLTNIRLKKDADNVFMAFFSDALQKKLFTAPCT